MSRIVDAVVKLAVVVVFMLAGHGGYARTFEFKAIGTKGVCTASDSYYSLENASRSYYQVKIGSAFKSDSRSEIEIRVATVVKNTASKKNGICDVATLAFSPINTTKPLYFRVASGVIYGWQVSGCIIEIWQDGKVVRHWSNISGADGKVKVSDGMGTLRIRPVCPTEIIAVDSKGEKVDLDAVLNEYEQLADPEVEPVGKRTYYIISDVRNVDCNRDYILRCIEHNRDIGSYVQKRKFTADELSDYKMEHPKCKEFTSMESVKKFVANGETAKSNAHWYFAVRNAKSVSQYDKRIALEEIVSGAYGEYNGGNVLKRKMTEEEVLDFKALNPDCKMFRDVEEFKAFIRAAEVRNANTVVAHDDDIVPVSRIARRRERQSQTPIPTEETVELSAEEVQKRVDAEMEYDKEMFEKKFGKEARK